MRVAWPERRWLLKVLCARFGIADETRRAIQDACDNLAIPREYTLAHGVEDRIQRLQIGANGFSVHHHFLFIDKSSLKARALRSGLCTWSPSLAYVGYSIVHEDGLCGFLPESSVVIRLVFKNHIYF